jgi:molybdenum cofactor cytidylyltransferase
MQPIAMQTAAIILAAGSSSRMGEDRHKLLLPLGDRPVVAHVLAAALASQARPIVLVLGHRATEVKQHLEAYLTDPAIILVENVAYRQGMSTSLRAGLIRLEQGQPAIDSAIMLLGDQPLLSAAIIDTLIEARKTTRAAIIAPQYHGKRGNPVLFAARLFPELLQVTGDEGGRQVVLEHRREVASVELGSELPNYDVDTWEAYQQVVALWEEQQRQGRDV